MSLRNSFWSSQQPWATLRTWVVPRLFRLLHSALMSTLKLSTSGLHRIVPFLEDEADPAARAQNDGAVLVIWHDHTLVPLHLFRQAGIATLMSTSRNGRLYAGVWALYGWPIVWGSTNKREGILALREMLKRLRDHQTIGFTPDGPRGPTRQAHGGVVYLASKAPAVIHPMAYSASNAWHLPTWDNYLIPKPFARVHLHVGPAIHIPPNLTREETEQWQVKVTDALNEAERIARWELDQRRA